MKRAALVCFLGVCAATPTLAVEPSRGEFNIEDEVAALAAGVEKRHASYRGFKFDLHVAVEIKAAPDSNDGSESSATKARDTFAILAADKPDGRPWRFWLRKVKDAEGKWVLDRFVAYDGSKSHSFRRTPPRVDGPRLHEGYMYAWEDWPGLAENVFDRFLFMLPNGVGANVPLTAALRGMHLDRFRIESRQPADGSEMIVLLGSSNAEFGMKYRAVMTGKPDHMLHEWEAKYVKQNDRTLLHYKVQEVKRLEGVPYPARGSYHQVGIGAIEDLKYDFEVTSVVRLDENERKLWLPPWPPATSVRDHINNKNFQTEAQDGNF